jgi:hypothetical protein
LSLRALYRTNRLLLGLLLSCAAWSGTPRATLMAQVAALPPPKPPFTIRSYGGKCLDFGASPQVSGAPVFINACNGTAAQQVFIEEVNVYHEVILRAGTLVIGVRSEIVSAPPPGRADAVRDGEASRIAASGDLLHPGAEVRVGR